MIEHGPNPYLALYYVKTENSEEMDELDTGILQGNAHSGSIWKRSGISESDPRLYTCRKIGIEFTT